MQQFSRLIIYPVKDIEKAKALWSKFLGVEPYADSPYYVGYKVGDQEIGLANGAGGPTPYWDVDDIKQSLKSLLDAGAQLQQDARDVGGGLQVASVKDADGNSIGLRQNP